MINEKIIRFLLKLDQIFSDSLLGFFLNLFLFWFFRHIANSKSCFTNSLSGIVLSYRIYVSTISRNSNNDDKTFLQA